MGLSIDAASFAWSVVNETWAPKGLVWSVTGFEVQVWRISWINHIVFLYINVCHYVQALINPHCNMYSMYSTLLLRWLRNSVWPEEDALRTPCSKGLPCRVMGHKFTGWKKACTIICLHLDILCCWTFRSLPSFGVGVLLSFEISKLSWQLSISIRWRARQVSSPMQGCLGVQAASRGR